MSGFHHVEVWVSDASALPGWRWLLAELGFEVEREWPDGMSWAAGGAYLTITVSPTMSAAAHDRRRAGVNHLAFKGGAPERVDAVMSAATAQGWCHLYRERYPFAGGSDHYAGWLENVAGFKVEIVAER